MTGVLEWTKNHEIKDNLNLDKRSSSIPDYLVLGRDSATKQTIHLIVIGQAIERWNER